MNEQLVTEYGKEVVYISKRKGFIKLAMKSRKNVKVVPVYVFGVNDMYYTSKFMYKTREYIMKTLGMCLPIASGYLNSGFVPLPPNLRGNNKNAATTIVFGKPMTFNNNNKTKDPNGSSSSSLPTITNEELDIAHEKFCKSLKELFDENKTKLGYGDRELIMI